jgi:hypothetical protein
LAFLPDTLTSLVMLVLCHIISIFLSFPEAVKGHPFAVPHKAGQGSKREALHPLQS